MPDDGWKQGARQRALRLLREFGWVHEQLGVLSAEDRATLLETLWVQIAPDAGSFASQP